MFHRTSTTSVNRWLRLTAKAAAAAGLLACSGAHAETLPAPDQAHVQEICKSVMGLSPGEVHYDGCVQSLGRTVAQTQNAKVTQSQRETCITKGLRPGTRDFAVCVLAGS